jgi:CheY-like chemotaxis protein
MSSANDPITEPTRTAVLLDAIGRLSGDVAHDFNNLLSVILGCNAIVLRKLPADDPLLELVEQVQKAGERAAQLARQLLAFNREQLLLPAPSGTESILLVMVNDLARTLAALTLQAHGYHIVEADNGAEAIHLPEVALNPIHLLITDEVLPAGMSGRQLAERMTALKPALKVLFLSGASDDGATDTGFLADTVPLLQWPFWPEALLRKVRKLLDGELRPGRKDVVN